MELGGIAVVADSHVGAELHELVDCLAARRAEVGGRDDADRATALDERAKLVAEWRDAGPADECTDEVDVIGAAQLLEQELAERWLPVAVDE